MMRLRFSYILLLASSLLLFACHKEMSIEKANGLAGDFEATINGTTWIASDSAKSAAIIGGLINITGISADNKQLSITLNDTVAGTYTLNSTSISLAAYADIDSSGLYAYTTNESQDTSQAGGTVTITEIDKVNKTITGTFSFKMYRMIDQGEKVVTQGVFYKLSYSSSLPPTSNSDTMTAVVDGNPWSAPSVSPVSLTGQLAITGSQLDGSKSVILVMPVNITPGDYAMDYTGYTYFALYSPSPSSSFVSSMGNLTILSNDASSGRIKGSFQFIAVDPTGVNSPHQFTQGYFSVKYQ